VDAPLHFDIRRMPKAEGRVDEVADEPSTSGLAVIGRISARDETLNFHNVSDIDLRFR
jgi:hypothetical protein